MIFNIFWLVNSGRALEEVRSSLFNKFHLSESAKRQDQRLCHPVVALSFNFVVAISIIFMNKWVILLGCLVYSFLIRKDLAFLAVNLNSHFFCIRFFKELDFISLFYLVLFIIQ